VLEVGMGGRLDATNVVEPRLSVITDISLDHQKFLGNTIAEIAREKVGIIRRGGVVVTLPQSPEANDVIGNAILEHDARVVSAAQYVPPVSPKAENYVARAPSSMVAVALRAKYPLQVMARKIEVETSLVGRHQLRNLALAIASAEELRNQGFPVTAESVERGIGETRWPGRFQVVPAAQGQSELVFDVAHNPAGAWGLRSTLSTVYEDRRIIFVFGAMRDKAIGEMTEILFPLGERVIATMAQNPRSATPQEIREAATRTLAEIDLVQDVASAVDRARSLAGKDGVVVITGSIYVVGEAMRVMGVSADAK
jgi:dihydrofolate synthase/folylpolyglutamate synthase